MQEAIPDAVLDRILEVSPFNALAYGLLTAAGFAWGILERRERNRDKEKFAAIMENSTSVLAVIEHQLPVIQEVKTLLPEVRRALDSTR